MEIRCLLHSVKLQQHSIQKCSFGTSTSLCARVPTKSKRKHTWKNKAAYFAQVPIVPSKSKEMFLAHKRRKQWDFPLGFDQRASWKHKQWYDPYYNKWVRNYPNKKKRSFSLYNIKKRGLIEEQKTLENRFKLLLDHDYKKKYVVPSYNTRFTRNASYYYQHLTHTKFVHGMPYSIESLPLEESAIENFENFLTTAIQLETQFNKNTVAEKSRKEKADRLLSNIVQYLVDSASSNSIFEGCELDINPENSMFWQKGRGFHKYTMRHSLPITFQSHDNPLYQIRTQKPLNEFTPWMENFMLSGDIPFPDKDILPSSYSAFPRTLYRNTVTPGIRYQAGELPLNYQEAMQERKLLWLPPPMVDPCKYGHTQFISLPESFNREWYKANLEHCDITEEIEEHIKAHGMMSGWTWSAPMAYYMRHWMDNDITEPLCVQTVISDGEYISFFCYQLNTVAIDPENLDKKTHKKRNVCYGTPMMKLFNKVEGTDDIQLYRDATSLLLKFINNGVDNKPNIDDVIKHNDSLEVQKFDLENPLIELQKPKHKREKEERDLALELARQEEIAKNKNLKDKVLDWVKGTQ